MEEAYINNMNPVSAHVVTQMFISHINRAAEIPFSVWVHVLHYFVMPVNHRGGKGYIVLVHKYETGRRKPLVYKFHLAPSGGIFIFKLLNEELGIR